ncbi:MAG: hypothetical protein F6K10_09375 [Moorea sp. SIO2B7]|nr:hypothetical protein [Moorena sp. SIO2B7]
MFLTFTNHIIELKEYASHTEMEQSLKQWDLGSIILGEEIDIPEQFYAAMIQPQTAGLHYFGIGICAEGYGLKPHFLLLPQSNIILFGFNNQVVGINVNQREIAFKIKLNSLFYYFLQILEKQIILIVQELDIVAINEHGKELWRYGKDVSTDTCLNGENIQLNFMNESRACLNILSGDLVEI